MRRCRTLVGVLVVAAGLQVAPAQGLESPMARSTEAPRTTQPAPPEDGTPRKSFGSEVKDASVVIQGRADELTMVLPASPDVDNVRIEPKTATCGGPGVFAMACAIVGATEAAERCEDPLDFDFAPTTISELDRFGNWTAPVHNSFVACATAPAAPPPVVFTEADFQALPIAPSTIVVGPAGGWLPVQMDNIAYTDATPQVFTTTVVGQAVTIRATPTQFTWDWADGSTPTTTADPGQAWPNQTVAHPYTQAGDYTVTMTTQWSGELSLDGGATFQAITGAATTVSTAPPVSVTELRSRLVDDLVY